VLTAALSGCGPLLPENVDVPPPKRVALAKLGEAVLKAEAGVDDALWLEVPVGRSGQAVGGYISPELGHRGAMVLMIAGSSTLAAQGSRAEALHFYRHLGGELRGAGFAVWSLRPSECGAAYGREDLAEALAALDWIDGVGRSALDAQRVYVVGHSAGATVATLINRQRDLAGVVAMSGLSEPDQLLELFGVYRLLGALFPSNTGICYLDTTLRAYAEAGEASWDALDTVQRIEEIRNPSLFIHGNLDAVYLARNMSRLERRYLELTAQGVALAPMEFWYLPRGGHSAPYSDPHVWAGVVAWLEGLEALEDADR
jgi:pimeloyl-ACP methyl ester carboxylesterase